MRFSREDLAVYFIMGSDNCGESDPLYVLNEALVGGITCFQYREKGLTAKVGEEKEALARAMQRLCQKFNVPFIVNDDLELALTLKADGIHVGQDDYSVDQIKAVAPDDFIIGVSATSDKEAVQAVRDGADYIGVGPIKPTRTKDDAKTPIGLEGIRSIRAVVNDQPLVAIGGIGLNDVFDILRSGADGVSVISAISLADNPRRVVQLMRETRF